MTQNNTTAADLTLVSKSNDLDALVSSYTPSRGEVLSAMYPDVVASAKAIASSVGKVLSYVASPFTLPSDVLEDVQNNFTSDLPRSILGGLLSVYGVIGGEFVYKHSGSSSFATDSHPVLYTWLAANAVSGVYALGRTFAKKYAAAETELKAKKLERVRAVEAAGDSVLSVYDSFKASGGKDEEFSAHYDAYLSAQSPEGALGVNDVDDLEARLIAQKQDRLRAFDEREMKLAKIHTLLQVRS